MTTSPWNARAWLPLLCILLVTPPVNAQLALAEDTERPPIVERSPSEPESDEGPCDLWAITTNLEACRTPRDGTLSGFYMGFDVGFVEMTGESAARVGVAAGPAFQLRLGLEFWDHVLFGGSFGSFFPADERPMTELVVDCVGDECGGSPYAADSTVQATFLGIEIGGQHRFRPAQGLSISPGVMLGLLEPLSGLERAVDCRGCETLELDADAGGYYAAPFLRLTFGNIGQYAAILRSHWFLTGDIRHMSAIGFEYGLP